MGRLRGVAVSMLALEAAGVADAPVLANGLEIADEFFDTKAVFESEEALEQRGGKRKKGRLGRMTYEFRTADVLNGNRRIYPGQVVAPAFDDLARRVGNNQVFGNLDHPSVFDPESLIVKLSEACVKVSEAKLTNATDCKVVVDILDNEDGRRLVSILNVDGNPGISQRAVVRWREANDDERARFKVPPDEYVRVAEYLRLITYDIVSEPGFADAQGAKVGEHKADQGVDQMTLDELKSKFPQTYALCFGEGKAAGVAETMGKLDSKVAAAVEAAKPAIVTEAQKALTEQLTKAQEDLAGAKTVLATVKPALVKLGLVNEQITDAQAATKIATLEAEKVALESKIKTADDTLKTANEKLAAAAKREGMIEGLKAVHEHYKQHPHRERIVAEVARRNIAEKPAALAAALEVATLIDSVRGGGGGGAPPATPANDGLGLAHELGLVSNPQGPGSGGGGGAGRGFEGLTPQQRGVASLLGSGGGVGL